MRYLRCEEVRADDVLALGYVELLWKCILTVKSLEPSSETRNCDFKGPWAEVLRWLARQMEESDLEDSYPYGL